MMERAWLRLKEGFSDVVKKMYKSSKGSGERKIYHKLKKQL